MEDAYITSNGRIVFPVGYRFRPSDDDLVNYYLKKKVFHQSLHQIIPELDVFQAQPSMLPRGGRIFLGVRFFFTNLKQHVFASMEERPAGSGYWKTEGRRREIAVSETNQLVGIKNTLVFWEGRGTFCTKTNWVLHEFRLARRATATNPRKVSNWAVYRLFQKKTRRAEESDDEEPSNGNNVEAIDDTAEPSVIDVVKRSGGSGPPTPCLSEDSETA